MSEYLKATGVLILLLGPVVCPAISSGGFQQGSDHHTEWRYSMMRTRLSYTGISCRNHHSDEFTYYRVWSLYVVVSAMTHPSVTGHLAKAHDRSGQLIEAYESTCETKILEQAPHELKQKKILNTELLSTG